MNRTSQPNLPARSRLEYAAAQAGPEGVRFYGLLEGGKWGEDPAAMPEEDFFVVTGSKPAARGGGG